MTQKEIVKIGNITYNLCPYLIDNEVCRKLCRGEYCHKHNKPKCTFIDDNGVKCNKLCSIYKDKIVTTCKDHTLNKCNYICKDGTTCNKLCVNDTCYQHSEKVKETRKKYRLTEEGYEIIKECQRRYIHTDKGRKTINKYRNSKKHKDDVSHCTFEPLTS